MISAELTLTQSLRRSEMIKMQVSHRLTTRSTFIKQPPIWKQFHLLSPSKTHNLFANTSRNEH